MSSTIPPNLVQFLNLAWLVQLHSGLQLTIFAADWKEKAEASTAEAEWRSIRSTYYESRRKSYRNDIMQKPIHENIFSTWHMILPEMFQKAPKKIWRTGPSTASGCARHHRRTINDAQWQRAFVAQRAAALPEYSKVCNLFPNFDFWCGEEKI